MCLTRQQKHLVTYMSSGLKRCMMAQKAKPSRKEADISVMRTWSWSSHCARHQSCRAFSGPAIPTPSARERPVYSRRMWSFYGPMRDRSAANHRVIVCASTAGARAGQHPKIQAAAAAAAAIQPQAESEPAGCALAFLSKCIVCPLGVIHLIKTAASQAELWPGSFK